MANNHIVTKNIGNLRGFSTDSLFLRPANVAEIAENIQKAPDRTIQARRGYQAQIGQIGGMGMGTFDDPATGNVSTVCVGQDGKVYNKLTKNMYFTYDGRVTGVISAVTNANPAVFTSAAHGLPDGTVITIHNANGLLNGATNTVNEFQFVVSNATLNTFTLNGPLPAATLYDSSTFTAYIANSAIWSIAAYDQRFLSIRTYVDPSLIYNFVGQSINFEVLCNYAAQFNGTQTNTNIFNVLFGHNLAAGQIVQFYDLAGILQTRTVAATTTTTISIDGPASSAFGGSYFTRVVQYEFGKGFDVTVPFFISDFLTEILDDVSGVPGLTVVTNGDTNLSAAFLQIFESKILPSQGKMTLEYWYWQPVHSIAVPPLPGSANPIYQNSLDFENASTAVFDDVIYIANGWDFPQKYDGQNVYRTGAPIGSRPFAISSTTDITSQPFINLEKYEYAITYEQIDNRGHSIEGEISEVKPFVVSATPSDSKITINNIQFNAARPDENWNTNGATCTGGTCSLYGPDKDGFYYNLAPVTAGYTLQIGDTAYYGDINCAVANLAASVNTLTVTAGHGVRLGDRVYFYDSTAPSLLVNRLVTDVTATTITINLAPVSVAAATPILVYKESKVFGNVAIADTTQTPVDNNILVKNAYPTGHTIIVGNVVEFIDSDGNLQRRTVTFVDATHVTVDGPQISINDLTLITSISQRANAITLQRLRLDSTTTSNAIVLSNGATAPFLIPNVISNNLRINLYRTKKNTSFGVDGKMFLVASIPNDSANGTQIFFDGITDNELRVDFSNPILKPNPPPISKYIRSFGNQMFYAGGERGNPENSDLVFFSQGNSPESVPAATNSFNVPNFDDDITGIGVAGASLIVTKTNSLWGVSGNFLANQIEVIQIAQGANIGCIAHASIASVGPLMYFLHTNGVYAITENQIFPTDSFGNPVAISLAVELIFRQTNYLPQYQYVLKRAVGCNYSKDNIYLLFLPCEDSQAQTPIRTANSNSIMLCYDYQDKNWFTWTNMNAAGGMVVINDDLFFQERRFSRQNGTPANLYKQHRFYRLIDHADHAGAQYIQWRSSWEDLGQPEIRKKFCRCILLMDRLSEIQQFNNPEMEFSSYCNRQSNLPSTIKTISQVDNVRNAAWSFSGWGWNSWSGYQDTFITVNLKQGTVAKSLQVGFKIKGINYDIRLAGFQLEAIPENRITVVR
jgi:phage tail protein X